MTQAIADVLLPYGTVAQRDAAIAAALASYYTQLETGAAITAAIDALRGGGPGPHRRGPGAL